MANLIKVKSGVRLLEAKLRSGTSVAAIAYSVLSERTPEAQHFNSLVDAERYFAEEVKQSSRTR